MALFRIVFGLVILWEQTRLLWQGGLEYKYLNTVFHFKYIGFEWVKQLPDTWMYAVLWISIVAAFLFIFGLFFRVSAILLLLIYTYIFLLDASYWNNHYYLYVFLLFLFSITDSHRKFSIDAKRKHSDLETIPAWQLYLFQFMIAVPLVFGAFSKLINPDWLNNTSMEHILTGRFEFLEMDVSEDTTIYLAWFMTLFGFLYDLLIIPILLFKRTFWIGVVLSLIFNLSNHFLLHIGSFPWAMLGSLLLFYPFTIRAEAIKEGDVVTAKNTKLKLSLLSIFVFYHLCMPFRHFFIEGQVFWTSEGLVGAWHMMSGSTDVYTEKFLIMENKADGTTENHIIYPQNILNYHQLKALGEWPAMAPQFFTFLTNDAIQAGFENPRVFGTVYLSRNGRKPKAILNIDQDLAKAQPSAFQHNDYVLLYVEEE